MFELFITLLLMLGIVVLCFAIAAAFIIGLVLVAALISKVVDLFKQDNDKSNGGR